jgi:hypothetical protein
LDPGVDPITEADRRGAILGVIRLGNKDVELPGSDGHAVPSIPGTQSVMEGAAVSYQVPGGPLASAASPIGPTGLMPSHVAGVTAPEYGMPITGTPIGLPGPPHIPLGGPAGLRSHVIKNNTRMHIPDPTKHVRIGVRQQPGYSYPTPPNRAHIVEQSVHPSLPFGQPRYDRHEHICP